MIIVSTPVNFVFDYRNYVLSLHGGHSQSFSSYKHCESSQSQRTEFWSNLTTALFCQSFSKSFKWSLAVFK